MPYKSEKIKIAGSQYDLRIKISPEQKRAILDLYAQGYSQRKLANIFGCSKGTIQNIVNPSTHKSNAKRRPTEYWTLKKKQYRQRKQKLYLSGKLK